MTEISTRSKQIRFAANTIIDAYNNLGITKTNKDAFEMGAEWADDHPQNRWINVNNELPTHNEAVLVMIDQGDDFCIAYYHSDDKCWRNEYTNEECKLVTHWREFESI